jgi:hypothetical protein
MNETVSMDFSDCQEYTDDDLDLLDSLSFYVEGVVQTPIAVAGLACNLATCVVLASKVELRPILNFAPRGKL